MIVWLRRVAAAIAAYFRPPPPPPPEEPQPEPLERLTKVRRLTKPLELPARGFVFTFQVHVWLTWFSDDLTEELHDVWSEQFSPRARRDVARHAADIARHFLPHQAAELEINLNRRLAGTTSTYERIGVVMRCRPAFRVRLDDEVKAHLRPAYLERMKVESQHEVALRRAQLLDQLTRRWIDIIARLRVSPFSAAAARLSDDRLATILAELELQERRGVDKLAERLREAIQDSNRVGQPLEKHEADEIIDLLNEALQGEGGLASVVQTSGNGRSNTA